MKIRSFEILLCGHFFFLALWLVSGLLQIVFAAPKSQESKKEDYITWADFHPEVAKIFDSVWDYKKIDWPCEKIDTGVRPVRQPFIVTGPGQELFVGGQEGRVYHSQDLGKSWSLLCQSPPLTPEVPKGARIDSLAAVRCIGVTTKGTLLMLWRVRYKDERIGPGGSHRGMYMVRSEDRGKTWEATNLLDPSPYNNIGGTSTIIQLRDGRLMIPLRVEARSRPGKAVSISKGIFRSFIYTSTDDGKTWSRFSEFTDHSPEPHLLELPSGKIVAALRYQRRKLPGDQPKLGGCSYHLPSQREESIAGGPTAVGRNLFQHTAFTFSEDGGKTWATPRLVTGALAQTGCLVRLSDGTLVLTFGRTGQYAMLSYDEGKTWSKAVYQLNGTGEYARSVALEDDTIITIHDNVGSDRNVKGAGRGRLMVLRWKAPPREEVEKQGFFTPREVETGLQ